MIPSFLLKKLYVKGSLANTEDGFEFAIKNSIEPGTIVGLTPLLVDEAGYPPEAVTIKTPKGEWPGGEISSQRPMFVPMNVEIKIAVQGEPLLPGEHHLVFSVLTREAGRLQIEATDTL